MMKCATYATAPVWRAPAAVGMRLRGLVLAALVGGDLGNCFDDVFTFERSAHRNSSCDTISFRQDNVGLPSPFVNFNLLWNSCN